jgi:Homing endonuclease associated repeat
VTKEEIIAAIRECAEKLGRSPKQEEFMKKTNVPRRDIRRKFGSYTRALRMAGLQPASSCARISLNDLFVDWAGMARSLGKVPSIAYYQRHSKYSVRPLIQRCANWRQVPLKMKAFAEQAGLAGDWADVLAMVEAHRNGLEIARTRPAPARGRPRVWKDRPLFGPPLISSTLAHCPTNELGVIYLFGMLAGQLGFIVTHIKPEFPDCEAIREVEKDRWQRVRIEFEYESRNFRRHFHRAEECDVIVCWTHNWPDCPLDVVELRTVMLDRQNLKPAAKEPISTE